MKTSQFTKSLATEFFFNYKILIYSYEYLIYARYSSFITWQDHSMSGCVSQGHLKVLFVLHSSSRYTL